MPRGAAGKGPFVRYEYEGRVSQVEDAPPKDEFDLCKEAAVEISGDAYASIRVPAKEAGALYGKRVRVIVEVDG